MKRLISLVLALALGPASVNLAVEDTLDNESRNASSEVPSPIILLLKELSSERR